MGKIYDALLKKQSSHRAKKENLWERLIDKLEDCQTPEMVQSFREHIAFIWRDIPGSWSEPLEEAIEKRLEEIQIDEEVLAGRYFGR